MNDSTEDGTGYLKYHNKFTAFAEKKSLKFEIPEPKLLDGEYFAKVKIGDQIFTTYPKCGEKDGQAAIDLACKIALEKLCEKDDVKYYNEFQEFAEKKSLKYEIKPMLLDDQYYAKVKVGDQIFTTYPNFGEKHEQTATDLACKIALEKLCEKGETNKLGKVEISTEDYIEFVLDLLKSKEHGYCSDALEEDLSRELNAFLPQNWFDILIGQDNITIGATPNSRKFLLYSSDLLRQLEESEKIKTWIPGPEIPKEGEYFEVIVIGAYDPNNVKLQPWQGRNEFRKLMEDMQYHYNVKCQEESVDRNKVKKGMFFACNCKEGTWYRVFVLNILKEEPLMVSVYFIDYGSSSVMPSFSLRTLTNEFRLLPYMAIEASLFGVEPIGDVWTEENNSQFQDLMPLRKEFISVIKEKWVDITLGLPIHHVIVTLIDTSDPERDVFIDNELIENNVCRRKSKD